MILDLKKPSSKTGLPVCPTVLAAKIIKIRIRRHIECSAMSYNWRTIYG